MTFRRLIDTIFHGRLYVSFESGGEITALSKREYDRFPFSADVVRESEWVWQRARSRAQAIKRHVAKHDAWYADVNAGRPERAYY